MIIRLHNPFAALQRHKAHSVVEKPVLSYKQRIKSDRLATLIILSFITAVTVVYYILY